jgi:hypothetical protein
MLWDEINFETAVWTIPAERMKRGREHEVPLSADAVALIKRLEPARIGKFVFPGRSNLKPVGHYVMWDLVQFLTDRKDGEPVAASPHGFRSSARSWMRARRVTLALAAIMWLASGFAHGGTLTCTDWQGIKTCTDGRGYVSHETERIDATDGWDSNGDSWTITHWMGQSTITITRAK